MIFCSSTSPPPPTHHASSSSHLVVSDLAGTSTEEEDPSAHDLDPVGDGILHAVQHLVDLLYLVEGLVPVGSVSDPYSLNPDQAKMNSDQNPSCFLTLPGITKEKIYKNTKNTNNLFSNQRSIQ